MGSDVEQRRITYQKVLLVIGKEPCSQRATVMKRQRRIRHLGGVDVLVYTPEEFAAILTRGNAFAELVAAESIF